MGRGSSGGEGHRLSAAIVFPPAGDLCGLLRRPSCFCTEGGWHRSRELPRRSNDSAASTSVGGRRAGHDRRGFAFAIISRPTDLNGYDQQQRTGRHFGPGPGRPSRPLDELAQLPGGDATVARVQLGLGGRRSLIGRSRCPTRRCTGRSPRASARNTKAHGGLGRRCIIDLPFRASPVNGKAFDGRTLAGVTSFRQRPELEKRYNRQHHCQ